jgi:hypothetical protein
MKKINFLSVTLLLSFFGCSLFFSSCSSTSGVTMEVLVPAQINLPKTIKKVAVVNRSLPAKGEGFSNFLEGFITGENIRGDRDASNNCVKGLVTKLNDSPRLGAVLVNYPQIKGTGTREWPLPLDWTMVDSICTMYKSDALVVLETFDSDVLFNTGKNMVKQTINNKDTMVAQFFTDLRMNVNAGWRVYDNINKKIIDQNSYMDEKGWQTQGATSDEALKKLPNKRDALNGAGLYAGDMYGIRISPTWANVYRSYYKKGNKENGFKVAKKWVKQNKWDQAVIIWTNLAKSTDVKIAGRAYYNLALASEMDGDLDQALIYANKSVTTCNTALARSYVNVINARIIDQDKLKEQMDK